MNSQASLTVPARWLLAKLIASRNAGSVTPVNPIKGKVIAEKYNEKFGSDYDDIDVRQWVHELRRSGEPIGSGPDGYFYCATQQEWIRVAAQLRSRIQEQQKAIEAPTMRFEQQGKLFAETGA
jgi:hypothetical protein